MAIAVVAHDFSDGLNTVGIMLSHRNSPRRSTAMLLLDAAAPVLGAASTLLFQVPPSVLILYLGFFAGFLLYIGVSDILPEAHSRATPAIRSQAHRAHVHWRCFHLYRFAFRVTPCPVWPDSAQ